MLPNRPPKPALPVPVAALDESAGLIVLPNSGWLAAVPPETQHHPTSQATVLHKHKNIAISMTKSRW